MNVKFNKSNKVSDFLFIFFNIYIDIYIFYINNETVYEIVRDFFSLYSKLIVEMVVIIFFFI